MAKLFITNNFNTNNNIVNHCEKQGFKSSFTGKFETANVIAFSKKNSSNDNFHQIGDELIIGIGSIIYKDFSNNNALKNILSDFSDENDIDLIKQTIIGNYVILIKKENNIFVFNDASNLYTLYYHQKNDNIYIGSDLFDLAINRNEKKSLTIDENNFLEGVFVNGILGEATIFKEIKKLLGHEYISINLRTENFKINHISVKKSIISKLSFERNFEKYHKTLINNINSIVKHYKNIAIFITGGLDSRVILSAFLNAGVKPTLLYGIGNSAITNTNNNDYEIVKKIAKKFDLELIKMNWSSPNPIDKHWDELSVKYGFHSEIYSGNINVIHEIEQLKNIDFIEFGYMGEVLRNSAWMDNYNKDFLCSKKLAELYLAKYNTGIIKNKEEIIENIENYFISVSERHEIDFKNISKDQNQIYDNEYRKFSDTHFLNFVNLYTFSLSILGNVHLLNIAATIPYDQKENGKFQIEIIRKLYAPVLSIPIFTHGKFIKIDKSNLTPVTNKTDLLNYLKSILLRNKFFLKSFSRLKLFVFPLFDKEKDELQFRTNGIKKYFNKKYNLNNDNKIKHISYAGAAYIAKYCHTRFIVDKIIKKK